MCEDSNPGLFPGFGRFDNLGCVSSELGGIWKSWPYASEQVVGLFKVLEQHRDLFLVCASFHILAKMPLHTLHIGK